MASEESAVAGKAVVLDALNVAGDANVTTAFVAVEACIGGLGDGGHVVGGSGNTNASSSLPLGVEVGTLASSK